MGVAALGGAASAAAVYTSVAASAITAYSQIQAARNAEKVNRHNQRVAEMRSRDAVLRGQAEELRHRQRVKQFIGRQRAFIAASGAVVDVGSPLDITTDTAALGEIDALTIRNNAQREALGLQATADIFGERGRAAGSEGTFAAFSTLVGTGAVLGSQAAAGNFRRTPSALAPTTGFTPGLGGGLGGG